MAITCLADQLRRDEGSKASAYQDNQGYWTIGIGTCIDERKHCGLTNDEIVLLFNNRVALAKSALAQHFPWTTALDPIRLGVLENMAFQMGVGGVAEFHNMLSALQQGDYAAASSAMLDSKWAKSQSPERALRLSVQLTTGQWQ